MDLRYPLDVIKVRLQSGTSKESTLESLLSLRNTESRRLLYRGFWVGLTGSSLAWCQYFYLYGQLKNDFKERFQRDKLSPIHHLSASFITGCIVQASLCPLWVVKVNQQLGIYPSFFKGFESLANSEGVKGLYRGLVPGLWSCMHGAVQFAVYEELQAMSHPDRSSTLHTLLSTIVSKVSATIVTSPIEVLKVRRRMASTSADKSIFRTLRELWSEGGISVFYRGVFPALLRVLPAQCLMFLTFENVKGYLISR